MLPEVVPGTQKGTISDELPAVSLGDHDTTNEQAVDYQQTQQPISVEERLGLVYASPDLDDRGHGVASRSLEVPAAERGRQGRVVLEKPDLVGRSVD